MRIILIVFVLAAAAPALAQDSPEAWLIPFAAAYQPTVGWFNDEFANPEHNLPAVRTRHYGWGLELRSLSGSFLFGPLLLRTWDDVDNDSYQLRTDATGIFGELGVKLAPASFLTIVPMLGVGGLSQSFNIRAKSDRVDFPELLEGAPSVISFSPGMKLAGLGALELGLIANTQAGRFGLAFRGGYIYSPLSLTWRLSNGAQVIGVPDSRLGGPFFSVGLLLMPEAQTAVR
jgi:hypothetical protein